MCSTDCGEHTSHELGECVKYETLNLQELLLLFHNHVPVNPGLINVVTKHAKILCDDTWEKFQELQEILKGHEATIRKRWFEMAADQRLQILLTAWPNMPEKHRPDYAEEVQFFKAGHDGCARAGFPSDTKLWPYINVEDLMRPVCLLTFLNTRGRHVPFNFSTTEVQFSPLTNLDTVGKQYELLGFLLLSFSNPFNQELEKLGILRSFRQEHNLEEFKSSLYPGLRSLQIQQRIMSFLLECSHLILHDMSESTLLYSATQVEPPASELDIQSDCGYTKYSDTLLIAPYRNRGAIEFSRLRGYFSALYTNSRDHLLALREDPSYFADTFQDMWEHSLELVPDAKGRTHPHADTTHFRAFKAKEVVTEAYTMSSIWQELYLISENLENLSKDNDDRSLVSIILHLACRASNVCGVLMGMLSSHSMSAPRMRRLHVRHNPYPPTSKISASSLPWYTRESAEDSEGQMMHCFDNLTSLPISSPAYCIMDYLDYILRTDEATKSLLSPRLSELIAQLSIVAECLVQSNLWKQSPLALPVANQVHECHKSTFTEWLSCLESFDVPLHLVDPTRGKLKYPAHKKRNKNNVQAMRAAEANLDQFWASIDEFFEEETGVAQHEIILECMGNWEVQRTPEWKDTEAKTPKPKTSAARVEQQPFLDTCHKKENEVTGSFNKLSVNEKIKLKTKGSVVVPPALQPAINNAAVNNPTVDHEPKLQRQFLLDSRSYNAIATMFHTVSVDNHNLPKAVKWDEFKRAMVRIGFAAEKLQGSAWQFSPSADMGITRSIHFHEPHPCSDIPYIMAKRFGRRLSRAYGWCGEMFVLG